MAAEERISEAFGLIGALAAALGVTRIDQREGCWEHALDARWWFAINGHDAPTMCSHGVEVLPFHCYLEFKGVPAGMFSPYGGLIAAGSFAHEAAFVASLRGAIQEVAR